MGDVGITDTVSPYVWLSLPYSHIVLEIFDLSTEFILGTLARLQDEKSTNQTSISIYSLRSYTDSLTIVSNDNRLYIKSRATICKERRSIDSRRPVSANVVRHQEPDLIRWK